MTTQTQINWTIKRKLTAGLVVTITLAFLAGIAIMFALNLSRTQTNMVGIIVVLLIIGAVMVTAIVFLRNTLETMEKNITDRAKNLEVVLGISQRLSGILELNALLQELVNTTKETFDYYHAHVYLIDDNRESMAVAIGYGRAGEELIRKGHKIRIDAPKSLVARAARERQIINVGDVQADPSWMPNPVLPDTRAEIAVPVILGDEVVGVLDVQSAQVNGFDSDDEATLQALANQVAIAVHNTRLFSQMQQARRYQEDTVARYVAFVEGVARGDLSSRLSFNGQDDSSDALVVLGKNLNSMVGSLGELTQQIRQATVHIASAATEIMAATSKQASGASEQSAAISQTSTTIDEVKTIVEQSYAKAQAVAEQAKRTSSVSQTGQQAVINTVDGMSQIKEKVEGIAENILALSEQTQQIGEITATVNEIASQSNLLALNASVEAARAGEHGKGFAVVAVEVRNLAEQSKQATAQVKSILNEIQRATNAAVMATEEGTKGVDEGMQLTGQAGETIKQLAGSISDSANAAQQIVASAQQQTTGMEQIALAMDNINQATIQNLASIRQAEKSAQDLSGVAQQLEALVATYKLDSQENGDR